LILVGASLVAPLLSLFPEKREGGGEEEERKPFGEHSQKFISLKKENLICLNPGECKQF
jgi:hypothetical protein